jgi:hypothetical protein
LAAGPVPTNTYANWIAGFSGVGAATGLNDDPDNDGIKNALENFFGTAPDAASTGLIPGTLDKATNTFTFTHPVSDTPADDLIESYEWSTDLTTYYTDGASNAAGTTTVTFTPGTPVGGVVTVQAVITGTVIPDRFFAVLKVTQIP